jgi:hypothetical protein
MSKHSVAACPMALKFERGLDPASTLDLAFDLA